MITYSKRWFGLPLLFRISGTSWPHGIFPGLLSALLGLLVAEFEHDMLAASGDQSSFMEHPYPFQLFAFIVGSLIVFRTNFAYARYWEGRSTIAQMATKWLDGACMSVTFDAPGDVGTPYLEGVGDWSSDKALRRTKNGAPSHDHFVKEILHLFSLMHALALQHLRGDDDLGNLEGFVMHTAPPDEESSNGSGDLLSNRTALSSLPSLPRPGNSSRTLCHMRSPVKHNYADVYREQALTIIGHLAPEERRALEFDGRGSPIPTDARVTMVEGWIMRRLIARQKHEACDMGVTAPPILSRLYQVISDGFIGFGQAAKLSDTPFPFPYQNLLNLFLWGYVFTMPFVMNAWLKEPIFRFVLTFLAVWTCFSLNEVGNNLEDPYLPYDPNELALTQCQHSFNARLLSFTPVPTRLEEEGRLHQPKSTTSALAAVMPTAPAMPNVSFVPNSVPDSGVTVTVSPDANVTVTVPTSGKDSHIVASITEHEAKDVKDYMRQMTNELESKLVQMPAPASFGGLLTGEVQMPTPATFAGILARESAMLPPPAPPSASSPGPGGTPEVAPAPAPSSSNSVASVQDSGSVGPDQLRLLVSHSMQEAAAMHARYLHTLGLLDGALRQQQQQQQHEPQQHEQKLGGAGGPGGPLPPPGPPPFSPEGRGLDLYGGPCSSALV